MTTDKLSVIEGNKFCCVDCGVKYLSEKQKQQGGVATSNVGICCICGRKTDVISIRHYNNLKEEYINQNK